MSAALTAELRSTRSSSAMEAQQAEQIRTRDGADLLVRPITADDREAFLTENTDMQQLLKELGPGARKSHPEEEIVDYAKRPRAASTDANG